LALATPGRRAANADEAVRLAITPRILTHRSIRRARHPGGGPGERRAIRPATATGKQAFSLASESGQSDWLGDSSADDLTAKKPVSE